MSTTARIRMRAAGVGAIGLLLAGTSLSAGQWPHWRGPFSNGVSAGGALPTAWSEGRGVAWRVDLGAAGVSNPVVWQDAVLVTGQVGRSDRRPGNHPSLVQGGDPARSGERTLTSGEAGGTPTFVVAAFDWATGAERWRHSVRAAGYLPEVHDKHNLATPSPVTDGDVVIAKFGTGQVVALDLAGRVLWTAHLGERFGDFRIGWGPASSPVLYRDTVIFQCYLESMSFLVALDKRTGEQRWRAAREAGLISYSTPMVVTDPAGDYLLVSASDGIEAVRAADGASIWRFRDQNRFPIPVGVVTEGVLLTTRGYRSGPYYAIRLGGRGDITESHVVWRVPTGAPYVSSLVHYEGLIYSASETGIVTCLDAATGERVWQERIGGVFTASPIAGDGKIYLVAESGETVVLRAGRTPEVVSRNRLDAHLVASPAVSRGRLFLRGDDELYAIGG